MPPGAATFATRNGTGDAFHGHASQRIALAAGGRLAGLSNRGMGNEGLVLRAGKDYNGYFFARVVPDEPEHGRNANGGGRTTPGARAAATIVVALRDVSDRAGAAATLASVEIEVTSAAWAMYNFTLIPASSTSCVDIRPGSDPSISCEFSDHPNGTIGRNMTLGAGHVCQRCGGEVLVALATPGAAVDVDFVALHPGQWGRYAGLEVRRDAVEALKAMGVTAVRQGGSFADAEYYFWKHWRGPKWARGSFGASWRCSLESSWGPFDFIDMCNAAGIEPIITTAAEAGPTGKVKVGAAGVG